MSDERRTPEGNLALEQAYKDRDRYRREAAASQAQAATLREALANARPYMHEMCCDPGHYGCVRACNEAARLIAAPLDTSALDAVRAEERERCMACCDEALNAAGKANDAHAYAAAKFIKAAIRALGGRL